MKKLLLLTLLSGCAVMKGQYSLSTTTMPVVSIKERIMTLPQDKQHFNSGVYNWLDQSVMKEVDVSNPTSSRKVIAVVCEHSFPARFELDVPAHILQQITIDTTAEWMSEQLCHME